MNGSNFRRNVAVTGLGLVTPLGHSPKEVLRRIRAGESAAAPPISFDAAPFLCPLCAEVRDFALPEEIGDAKTLRLMNRDAQFALSAGLAALRDAGLIPGRTYPSQDIALFGATGLAGVSLDDVAPLIRNSAAPDGSFDARRFGAVALGKVRPVLSFKILSNMPICFLSIFAGIRGPSAVYNPWECQGVRALVRGVRAVGNGEVACALVGAADVKTHELAFISLQQGGAFDPWMSGGGGAVPSEGAVFLVLEDENRAQERGARAYCRITGWGMASSGKVPSLDEALARASGALQQPFPRGKGVLVSADENDGRQMQREVVVLKKLGVSPVVSLAPKAHMGNLFAAAAAAQLSIAALVAEEQESGVPVVAHCFGHGGESGAFLVEGRKAHSQRRTSARKTDTQTRRAVITGLGVVSPVGVGVEAFWTSLTSGRPGIGPVTLFDASTLPVRIAGEVKAFDQAELLGQFPEAAGERDRKVWLGLAAAQEALQDAGMESGDSLAVAALVVGVSLEVFFLEDVTSVARENDLSSALAAMVLARDAKGAEGRRLQTPLDRLAQLLGTRYGFGVARVTDCSACAAGANAVGEALHLVREGICDLVLAGAADSMVNPLGLGGFALLKALSEENDAPATACRPFDLTRQGTVLGEGAAFLVVESLARANARGAKVYAELLGFGASLDAYRVSDPEPTGEGAALAMRRALAHAGLSPDAVDCVNAHGTGTPKNDPVETLAIKRLLGGRAYSVPVHAVKSMTGHLIAASGAVEAVSSVLTLQRGVVPPTINLKVRDPECDLDYVPEGARPFSGRTVLSNSFGFGGQNAALIFGRFPA